MVSITGAQREILLKPIGNNIWSGQIVQTFNSNAITWSLAKQLYGPSGPYFIIPVGIFIGFGVTFVHWLIYKVKEMYGVSWKRLILFRCLQRWLYIGPVRADNVMLPIIYQYATNMVSLHLTDLLQVRNSLALESTGVNSTVTSSILVGLVSQFWLRRYHPGWYRKYNYILGGALDGGAQVMVFVLSFAVFGASGVSRPFPTVSCQVFPSL